MNIINTIFKYIAIKGVKFYRRFISPHKGFHCGHAHYTGSATCSTYGLKQLQTQTSAMEALRLIRHRLKACSHVTRLYYIPVELKPALVKKHSHYHNKQAGFVDCDVGGCDIPSCDCDLPSCDIPSCNVPDISHCDTPKCNVCDVASACDIFDCGDLFDFSNKAKKEAENITGTDIMGGMLVAGVAAHALKKEGSYIIPNFQLLDELEQDYLLYQYLPTKEYFKIHKRCVDWPLEDILSLNTEPETYKLTEDKVKKILKYRKKVNLSKN